MVGIVQTSGRIPFCRRVNYRVISSVVNEFLIGISCFVIRQQAMFTTFGQPPPTSHRCVASYSGETFRVVTLLNTPGGILNYGYYRY